MVLAHAGETCVNHVSLDYVHGALLLPGAPSHQGCGCAGDGAHGSGEDGLGNRR